MVNGGGADCQPPRRLNPRETQNLDEREVTSHGKKLSKMMSPRSGSPNERVKKTVTVVDAEVSGNTNISNGNSYRGPNFNTNQVNDSQFPNTNRILIGGYESTNNDSSPDVSPKKQPSRNSHDKFNDPN